MGKNKEINRIRFLKKIDRKQWKDRNLKEQWGKYSLFFLMIIGCIWFLFCIKPHQVKGISMLPTLREGDHLLIKKRAIPSRYSLITFEPKDQKGISFVKRVIGMPGDHIWLDNDTLYINSEAQEEKMSFDSNQFWTGEKLPDSTLKVWVTEKIARSIYQTTVIPENAYFVMGDNRKESMDSRQLGFIHQEQIEGVVVFQYYPFNRLGITH